jgi:hypothetical protein
LNVAAPAPAGGWALSDMHTVTARAVCTLSGPRLRAAAAAA